MLRLRKFCGVIVGYAANGRFMPLSTGLCGVRISYAVFRLDMLHLIELFSVGLLVTAVIDFCWTVHLAPNGF